MNELTVTILMWGLLGGACVLLLFGVGWDFLLRLRKRVPERRCLKCWYNLSYSPGMTCSECGYTASQEKYFRKLRIRKRLVALACVFFLASYGAHLYPGVKARGWVAAIPTTVLILMLPEAGSEAEERWDDVRREWVWNPLCFEMGMRLDSNRVADWQLSIAIRRARIIHTRERWPIEEPLIFYRDRPFWLPLSTEVTLGSQDTRDLEHGTTPSTHNPLKEHLKLGENSVQFRVRIGYEPVGEFLPTLTRWNGIISTPVQGVETIEDVITPVQGDIIDRLVAERIQLYIKSRYPSPISEPDKNSVELVIDRSPDPQLDNMAIQCMLEYVNYDGKVIDVVEPVRFGRSLFDGNTCSARFKMPPFNEQYLTKKKLAGWRIRLRGDARLSLSEFDCDTYWAGSIEYDLADLEINP